MGRVLSFLCITRGKVQALVFAIGLVLGQVPAVEPSQSQTLQQPPADAQVEPSAPVRSQTEKAQKPAVGTSQQWRALRETANANTIYLMAGAPTGTAVTLANDIALALSGSPVRVLPVIGQGSSQNIYDVLLLRGIDLGLTFADTLEIVRDAGQLPTLQEQIRYISVFGVSDVHLIAPRSIERFKDLKGRKVAADVAGSGSNLSARYVFSKLKMDVEVVDIDFAKSVEMLRRGEIDAIYKSEVRPNSALADLRGEVAANVHLLPIPFDPRLSRAYQPSIIPAGSYPDLAAAGVETIGSPLVLISYDWKPETERYNRVEDFVTALFDNFPELQQPGRHPSWNDVNIGAQFPGWRRFPTAETWLEARKATANRTPAVEPGASDDTMRRAFAAFLDARGNSNVSAEERDALFQQFQAWMKTQKP